MASLTVTIINNEFSPSRQIRHQLMRWNSQLVPGN